MIVNLFFYPYFLGLIMLIGVVCFVCGYVAGAISLLNGNFRAVGVLVIGKIGYWAYLLLRIIRCYNITDSINNFNLRILWKTMYLLLMYKIYKHFTILPSNSISYSIKFFDIKQKIKIYYINYRSLFYNYSDGYLYLLSFLMIT